MNTLATILNPGILFFMLGLFASVIGSNLRIPDNVIKFISLYLMIAIGFGGGVSLYTTEFSLSGIGAVATVLIMSAVVPFYTYHLFKRVMSPFDAAAIGGTYGSNSTLTFITAAAFLASIDVTYGVYMTIALVVMEVPAIVFSVFLANRNASGSTWKILREAMSDGTVVTLLGSMLIGYILVSLHNDTSILTSFIKGDIFTGMLIFFLMYMGTMVGSRVRDIASFPWYMWLYAVVAPFVHGMTALLISQLLGMEDGSALLLIMLCASSSYIVAPAIFKQALPQADPAKYLSMSMGVTFPINIVVGIPLYWNILQLYG